VRGGGKRLRSYRKKRRPKVLRSKRAVILDGADLRGRRKVTLGGGRGLASGKHRRRGIVGRRRKFRKEMTRRGKTTKKRLKLRTDSRTVGLEKMRRDAPGKIEKIFPVEGK